MNRSRKNLIEELIRVGNLIGPISSEQTENWEQDELSNIETPKLTKQQTQSELEDIPVVNDVVEESYTTRDMFEIPEQQPQISEAEDLDLLTDYQLPNLRQSDFNINDQSTTVKSQPHLESDAVHSGFPIDDLASQLVMLIEQQVSKRSGEELDDVFRDELTDAVTAELRNWLDTD
ncbi:MAG: hypothetical protein CL398_05465 [Acidiferrobacteraceae bacterium]|nr:hypothetical protein [Acidiferrobacteraceae bacterium]